MAKAKKMDFQEEMEYVWDKKKIAIGVAVITLLVAGGLVAKQLLLGQSLNPTTLFTSTEKSVQGISTQATPTDTPIKISIPNQQDVQNQIQQIQQQVTHLNLAEVASSSPQVRQVLQQIQDLPKEGSSQVKDECYRICDRL